MKNVSFIFTYKPNEPSGQPNASPGKFSPGAKVKHSSPSSLWYKTQNSQWISIPFLKATSSPLPLHPQPHPNIKLLFPLSQQIFWSPQQQEDSQSKWLIWTSIPSDSQKEKRKSGCSQNGNNFWKILENIPKISNWASEYTLRKNLEFLKM